jgi:hypothetical protein
MKKIVAAKITGRHLLAGHSTPARGSYARFTGRTPFRQAGLGTGMDFSTTDLVIVATIPGEAE